MLSWVAAEHRKDVARILEIAERAAQRWDVTYSDFLSPPLTAECMSALSNLGDVLVVPWGGYAQAERCRLAVGREEVLGPLKDTPTSIGGVAALEVKGNFIFDAATHRDFLGAVLGTGVVREKVGDILVTGEQGAHVLVDPDLVEHFEAALTQVRTVPVTTRLVDLTALRVAAPRIEEMTTVEASMRLDAVASAGFRMSRGKMLDLVKAGDVRVNWRAGAKPSMEVQAGDIISCAGKGRLEVKSVTTTKKDKFAVQLVRYL